MTNGLTFSPFELVGTPQPSSWSQVFWEKVSDKPQLFFTISLVNNGASETAVLGKELAKHFQKTFYEEETPLLGLKKSLEELRQEAKDKNLEISLSAGALWRGCLYAAVYNQARVFLRRGDNIVTLLSGEKLETTSGFCQEDDLLILCSQGFLELVSLETVVANLDHKPLAEIIEALSPMVLGSPDNSQAAALFLELKREIPPTSVLEREEKDKIKSVTDKVSLRFLTFKQKFFPKPLFNLERPLVLPQKRGQKTVFSVAILILLLLLGSAVFGALKKQEEKEQLIFSQALEKAKNKYEEGNSLASLNKNLARSLLLEGKKEVEDGLNKLGNKQSLLLRNKNSKKYKTLSELDKQISDLLVSFSAVFKVQPQIFYDLSLISDKARANNFSLDKNLLVILDNQNKSVYTLQIDKKSAEIVAGGKDFGGSVLVSVSGNKAQVLTETGIWEINLNNKTSQKVLEKDKDWEEVVDLVSFSGNIYLLSKTSKQIIKYIPVEGGYSQKNYLANGVEPDFSGSVSFTIDGSVYVLWQNGNIIKFTQGRPDSFNISGLDTPLVAPQTIFTCSDCQNVYVLEGKRVVVLGKTGQYQAQYQWQDLEVLDMVVSESLGKILLLSPNKIYAIEIKK